MCINNFLKQETFLKKLHEQLSVVEDTSIETSLNNLRACLLKDKQLRFYMCTDLNILASSLKETATSLDSVWLKHFPQTSAFNEELLFKTNTQFCVQPMWHLKQSYSTGLQALQNECRIFTQLPKKDFIIGLGNSESSYLRLVSSLDINSYQHVNYAALLVLIEYFCQTEVKLIHSFIS